MASCCPDFCGPACLNGSCPLAPPGHDGIRFCRDCPYCVGCSACIFARSDYIGVCSEVGKYL